MSLLESEQRRSRRAQRKHDKAVKRNEAAVGAQTETEQQRESAWRRAAPSGGSFDSGLPKTMTPFSRSKSGAR